MSEHLRPKMKPMPFPETRLAEADHREQSPFSDVQPVPVADQGQLPGAIPPGAVLAEWRPRSHGRAGAVAAAQMLEALECPRRPHLKDRVHIYDGCTKLMGDD